MKKTLLTLFFSLIISQQAQALESFCFTKQDSTSIKQDSTNSYILSTILVKGNVKKDFDLPSSARYQKISLSQHLLNLTIGNLISIQPGIFTKSYGAEGSLQTISVRGTGSEYTTVYVNGINLSSTLNGVFDFSRFSSDEITEIIIKKGNDFDALNNLTIGSSIELIPFSKADSGFLGIKFLTGSFGLFTKSIRLNNNTNNFKYSLNLSTKTSRNNYKYDFQGQTYFRENADIKQNTISGSFINRFSLANKNISLKQFVHYINKSQGLPTFIAVNRHFNSETRKKENTLFYSNRMQILLNKNLFSEIIFGLHSSNSFIHDPLLSINLTTKSFELEERSYILKSYLNYVTNHFSAVGGISFTSEKFYSKELKHNSNLNFNSLKRDYLTASIQVNKNQEIIFDELNVGFSNLFVFNRYNYEDVDFLNWRIGAFVEYNKHINFKLFANTGKAYRIPNAFEETIYKLTSLKNEKLKNEKINNSEVGFKLDFSNSSLEVTYFNYFIENKIIWIPQRVAFFAPRNKGKIQSSGIELIIENIRIKEKLLVNFNYTFTEALNKNKLSQNDNSYNKQLIYIPKHKSTFTVLYHHGNLFIEFSNTYYSRRYYTEDNDKLFSLDDLLLSNISILLKQKIFGIMLNTQLSVLNLLNKSYNLIQSFPIPGREYRLTIQMEVL